jgi:hypothetical protein
MIPRPNMGGIIGYFIVVFIDTEVFAVGCPVHFFDWNDSHCILRSFLIGGQINLAMGGINGKPLVNLKRIIGDSK